MGSNLLASVLALGYEGGIYPVHPKETEVQGLKAYRSVSDLPEVPDLAVFVIPTALAVTTLDECGKKGIKSAIIVTAGFREVGEEGAAREKELLEVASRYGIRFLGPNCIGVVNTHHRLNTTFMEHEGSPGFIGMASQSGSFITQMFHYLDRLGLNFSTGFSVGNEVTIDLVDCMEYLGACPNTKVITLYIEGIRRGRAFLEKAREITRKKPIVAYYAGGSEMGKKAGRSHTGAMAGPDPLYQAMFKQCGILSASSVTELFDMAWVLGTFSPPEGDKVVIQTHSGGPGTEAADAIGRAGLELPALSDETRQQLGKLLPHTGSMNNPVDLTFTKDPFHYFNEIPRILLSEPACQSFLMYFHMPFQVIERALRQMGWSQKRIETEGFTLLTAQSRSVSGLLKEYGKPFVTYTYRSMDDPFIKSAVKLGIPVFKGPQRAIRALKALVEYGRIRMENRGEKRIKSSIN
jgi:acyl-CoA synthetase (NDP forming)